MVHQDQWSARECPTNFAAVVAELATASSISLKSIGSSSEASSAALSNGSTGAQAGMSAINVWIVSAREVRYFAGVLGQIFGERRVQRRDVTGRSGRDGGEFRVGRPRQLQGAQRRFRVLPPAKVSSVAWTFPFAPAGSATGRPMRR